MSIRFRLTTLITILFIVVFLNTIFIFYMEKLGKEKQQWIVHTYEVLMTSERLYNALIEAESGQRGFLLTQKESYLTPYTDGVIKAEYEINLLEALTRDNASQQQILSEIKTNIRLKLEELPQTINLAKQEKMSSAIDIVNSDKGKHYMDTLRSLLSIFCDNEKKSLDDFTASYQKNREFLNQFIFLEIIVFVVLVIITLFVLERQLFRPLKLLVKNTKEIEAGNNIKTEKVHRKDEIGKILSALHLLNQKVTNREKKLQLKAVYDPLTGLKNRSTVLTEIENAIQSGIDTNSNTAIFFIDLNDFKMVNDNYGHEYGDLLLREVAKRLSQCIRASDDLFRIGGDEFLIILKSTLNRDDITEVIRKLNEITNTPAIIKGKPFKIVISIGISIAPADSSQPKELIEFADRAMYYSKKENEQYFTFYDEISATSKK